MAIQGVIVGALSKQALRQIVIGVGTGLGGSVIAQTFDKTSRNICACLDRTNRILTEGFAGLGIEIKTLPAPLGARGRLTQPGLNPDDFIDNAKDRRARERKRGGTRNRAQRRRDAEALGGAMRKAGQIPGETASSSDEARPATVADQLKSLTETLGTLGKTISESLQPAIEALSESARQAAEALKQAGENAGGSLGPVDPIDLPGLMPGGPGLLQPADGGMGLDQALGNLEEGFAAVREQAGEAGMAMTRAFQGAIDEAGGLHDILGGLFDALGGLGGKAGELIGLFGRLFRGGGLGDLLGGLGGIFGFAGGGTVQPRLPAIVGERGPELFIPSAPGRIANASETRALLGAPVVTVNQSITLATDVRNTVRAEIANAAPLIAEATRRGLIDDFVRRGIL